MVEKVCCNEFSKSMIWARVEELGKSFYSNKSFLSLNLFKKLKIILAKKSYSLCFNRNRRSY